MASMHEQAVYTEYARKCFKLWRNWRTLNSAQRALKFQTAINNATSFMAPVDFKGSTTMTDEGEFSWPRWRLKYNKTYIEGDGAGHHGNNITWADFLELASTLYHETRHAEQFYRMAQGLAAEELVFPEGGNNTPLIVEGGQHAISDHTRVHEKSSKPRASLPRPPTPPAKSSPG